MVKDKNNLLSHNVWSGGQYLNNTTRLLASTNVEISPTVSLDKSCFEVTFSGVQWSFFDIVFNEFTVNSKIQAIMDIYTESPLLIEIYKYGNPNQRIMVSSVNVPASQSWGTYIISSNEIPQDTTGVRIRIYNSTTTSTTKSYITNCILNII